MPSWTWRPLAVAGALSLATGVLVQTPGVAQSAPHGEGTAPAASASPAGPTVELTGELVRLLGQGGDATDRSGDAVHDQHDEHQHGGYTESTLLRTPDGSHVPVDGDALADVPDAARVRLEVTVPDDVLAAARAGRDGLSAHDVDAATRDAAPADSPLALAAADSADGAQPLEVGSAEVVAEATAGSYSPGAHRVWVARTTPRGTSLDSTITQAVVEAQVDGASSYWSDVTGAGVTFTTDTVSAPYVSAYTCSSPQDMWQEAATRTGYPGYGSGSNNHLVLVLPSSAGCGYGLGSVGADVNYGGLSYVSDTAWPVLAHELGHNLGFGHANSTTCGSVQDGPTGSTSCATKEYGDYPMDVMASSNRSFAGTLSSPAQIRAGFLPAADGFAALGEGTHTVDLNPVSSGTGLRGVVVDDPLSDDPGDEYYVEVRTAWGRDGHSGVNAVHHGVRVMRLVGRTTRLMDATPTGSSTDVDRPVRAGTSFTSHTGGVVVTTESVDQYGARVRIQVGEATPPAPETEEPVVAGAAYQPVTPYRAMSFQPLDGGASHTLTLTGAPAGATAVALNVTAANPTADTWVSVCPGGTALSACVASSNVNPYRGRNTPNLVVAKLGTGNTVTFVNAHGRVDLIADVQGWFVPDTGTADAGARYEAVAPHRVMAFQPVGAGATHTLTLTGAPAGATAVALNVTAASPTSDTFVSVCPGGTAIGQCARSSNLNPYRARNTPGLVLAKLGAGNTVTFYNSLGTTQLIADVQGWYVEGPGAVYQPVAPERVLAFQRVGTRGTHTLTLPDVPAGATAVTLNVTSARPTGDSYVSVCPGGTPTSTCAKSSNLNHYRGQNVANAVTAKVDAYGRVTFYNDTATTDLIADVQGWYVSPAS
ncbi:M12 family metallo-peptidase [Thalassiella azotivora]